MPIRDDIEIGQVMAAARDVFAESGMTLHELGIRMGHPEESARKSAWQFIHNTNDPRISRLVRFCLVMGVTIDDLFNREVVILP